MTRPDDIPEDVWDAARHALFGSIPADAFAMLPFKDVVHMDRCARGILAERERAEKAATDTITQLLGEPLADSINGYVAAAIRSGKQ